jgi:hypothetical protein
METLAVSHGKSNPKQRAFLVLGILVFIACYQWIYIHWLNPTFDYFGYEYNRPSAAYLLLAWLLSALPSFWMPLSIDRPSKLIYWVLYLTVFIPSMFIPLFAGINKPSEVTGLMITLFAGFAITGLSYLRPLLNLHPPHLAGSRFWYGFSLVAGVLTLWVIVAFRGNLHIVSFMDIYDIRNAADDVMAGTWLNYPLMLLPGAIDPFLMGWGLYHKKPWMFVMGALGQLLVYGTMGTKGSVTSILFIPAIYFLVRGDRSRFAIRLTWSVIMLFVVLSVLAPFAGDTPGLLLWTVLFVVFSRVFGANGLLTAQYYGFFQINPHTYLSHAKVFNWFIHYPYANSLGLEVGPYYLGDPTFDATAHFWATDGIAGFGLWGILLVSALCAFVFWTLDSVAQGHDSRLAALVISYVAYNFANGSLFTTLLSGGLGLLMVILYLMPREHSEVSRKPLISPSVAPAG